MTSHDKLLDFAHKEALDYVISQEKLKKFLDEIAIILVGSVADGFCRYNSDVDICILAPTYIYDSISIGKPWSSGRPSEAVLNGIQIHYYSFDYEYLLKNIETIPDTQMYNYSASLLLMGNQEIYKILMAKLNDPKIQVDKLYLSIDYTNKRFKAMKEIFNNIKDPILRLQISIEMLENILKCIVLIDNIPFNPRKRFYTTALRGNLGLEQKTSINDILKKISSVLLTVDNDEKFISLFTKCIKSVNDKCLRSKYSPLVQYLNICSEDELRLTFTEIEEIINAELPKSARKYHAWWSNDKGKTHTHANSWLKEGYQTHSLSLTQETISFSKIKQ